MTDTDQLTDEQTGFEKKVQIIIDDVIGSKMADHMMQLLNSIERAPDIALDRKLAFVEYICSYMRKHYPRHWGR
jgi:hypothetical protein